ncbi:thymidine kinase [Culicoidibacter larvae]|uniref:Thymidine kinase n=1 Tax=Culicoidibacter larvae TaxID=2579976 RepID=A0A5R8QBR6_9FIRM|nr:thymidine kinase [Culicoidibacter larvae]TLG73952.1 thymidine kinase [Culicoidibacter larvae]
MQFDMHAEGWLEVICGGMFAGKTEELIRRVTRLQYAKWKFVVFRPKIDNRYSEIEVVSHNGSKIEAVIISEAREILNYLPDDVDAVAIDEVQFFDEEIIPIIDYLTANGVRVIVSGLDMDFRGEPFGIMGALLAKAEFVTKLTAICMKCGAAATRTQRIIDGQPASYNDPIVLVAATESYEARCHACHEVPDKPRADFLER